MENGQKNTELNPAIFDTPLDETGGKKQTLEDSKLPDYDSMKLPLVIKRVIQNQENGETEATLVLSREQLAGLLNVAIVVLLQAGMVAFQDHLSDNLTAKMLDGLDPKAMGQA